MKWLDAPARHVRSANDEYCLVAANLVRHDDIALADDGQGTRAGGPKGAIDISSGGNFDGIAGPRIRRRFARVLVFFAGSNLQGSTHEALRQLTGQFGARIEHAPGLRERRTGRRRERRTRGRRERRTRRGQRARRGRADVSGAGSGGIGRLRHDGPRRIRRLLAGRGGLTGGRRAGVGSGGGGIGCLLGGRAGWRGGSHAHGAGVARYRALRAKGRTRSRRRDIAYRQT